MQIGRTTIVVSVGRRAGPAYDRYYNPRAPDRPEPLQARPMKAILREIPESVYSERLLLRVPRPGDGKLINDALRESYEELHPWMPFARSVPPVDDTEEYCRNAYAAFIRRERWPLIGLLRTTGEFVVSTGLHDIDWDVPRFEIGYWVRTPYSGQGFVTEVVNRLTEMAFQDYGARRVCIRMDDRNERSWRVAERCGFQLEGIARNDAIANDGSIRSMRTYSKVA